MRSSFIFAALVSIPFLRHGTVKISYQNSATVFVSNYGRIDPPTFVIQEVCCLTMNNVFIFRKHLLFSMISFHVNALNSVTNINCIS